MLPLTIRQLKIFEAVARQLSITRAAEELHLSQPAVSMQMKKLAEVVGQPLLEQDGKRVRLTGAGEELAISAREVIRSLKRFELGLVARKGLAGGFLRLAAITTATYFVPRLLGEFAKLHPGVKVALRVVNREQALESLAAGLEDLYVLGQPPVNLAVTAQPFMENPLVVIAAPDHPLALKRNIPLTRLIEEPWLMREEGSGTRKAVERLFASQGLALTPRMELGSSEAIKQAVLAGLGISVLSQHSLALHSPDQFAILDAKGFPIRRQWHAVYPAERPLTVVARTFLDFLLTYGKSHDTDTN
ncbi:DNA-binding transcriptional LysR family regulator [Sulfuritortus calidifontis]|uniref:DNA-binding transcriptional LysR family regulator n=1 Tax=Sulfuritortus calidifontis TaxID=1914471 RepID=A0A4R3JWC4_9PROT|nr:LysR family transcriptional regulator [Sulfuritortus calidifontis]TCS72415.1 DNA-binding transcriptional LysR family regulator [Sulfuritortus calidifontis]